MKWMVVVLFLTFSVLSLNAQASKGDAKAGEAKSVSCQSCHGIVGISNQDLYPNLAGQKQGYLIKALKDYKTGARKDPEMNEQAKLVKDEDIADITAYFASLGGPKKKRKKKK